MLEELTMTTYRRVSVLLPSTVTVAGLAAGVAPAHAATTSEAAVARAYAQTNFGAISTVLQSGVECMPINLPGGQPARSVVSTSNLSKITLYRSKRFFGCADAVAFVAFGQNNSGFDDSTGKLNALGREGAYYYSAT